VLFSYQPEADETDADAIIRAQHPIVRGRCHGSRSQERSPRGLGTHYFLFHPFSFQPQMTAHQKIQAKKPDSL
jgi:hypothetical protein